MDSFTLIKSSIFSVKIEKKLCKQKYLLELPMMDSRQFPSRNSKEKLHQNYGKKKEMSFGKRKMEMRYIAIKKVAL